MVTLATDGPLSGSRPSTGHSTTADGPPGMSGRAVSALRARYGKEHIACTTATPVVSY
jgi:hypothetical protein